jgi:transcriptional regulator with XRE-family HTH domain
MNKNEMLLILGKRIRQLREKKGFSQENFAFKIYMNRGYYGAVERGEVNVSFLNLFKIAEGLDTTLAILFANEAFSKNIELTQDL